MRYRILTDSTGDLTPELVQELDLTVIPMEFTVDGKSYRNYPDGHEMSAKDFYDLLRAAKTSTTAQINSHEFTEWADPILQAGEDLLYIAFSPDSAVLAKAPYWPSRSFRKNIPTVSFW